MMMEGDYLREITFENMSFRIMNKPNKTRGGQMRRVMNTQRKMQTSSL